MSQTKDFELRISESVISESVISITEIIDEFNKRIIESHLAHYKNGQNELIDLSDNASPNENQIYHLYSNGEITHQKGAWAYLKRSEFNIEYEITGANKLSFKFVKEALDGTSYVILTEKECHIFREEMKKIVSSNKN